MEQLIGRIFIHSRDKYLIVEKDHFDIWDTKKRVVILPQLWTFAVKPDSELRLRIHPGHQWPTPGYTQKGGRRRGQPNMRRPYPQASAAQVMPPASQGPQLAVAGRPYSQGSAASSVARGACMSLASQGPQLLAAGASLASGPNQRGKPPAWGWRWQSRAKPARAEPSLQSFSLQAHQKGTRTKNDTDSEEDNIVNKLLSKWTFQPEDSDASVETETDSSEWSSLDSSEE